MPVYVSVEPVSEPLDLATVKSHLRIIGNDDDAYIRDLVYTARQSIEKLTQRSLVTRTLKFVADCFPIGRVIDLPHGPIQSVSSVTYKDSAGATQTLSSSHYVVDAVSSPGRVILKNGYSWPTTWQDGNALEVTYIAGFGNLPGNIPADLKQAMLLLIGHWYENREDVFVGSMEARQLPKAVDYLAMPYRIWT